MISVEETLPTRLLPATSTIIALNVKTSPSENPVISSNSLIVAEVDAPLIVIVFSVPRSAELIAVAVELRLPAPMNSNVPSASACT